EVADAHQHLRVDELSARNRFLLHKLPEKTGEIAKTAEKTFSRDLRVLCGFFSFYIPLFGTGTAVSNSSMIASDVTPSDSARKFVSTRCRNTGCASARMSS